jgi:hypothetical protein
MINSSQYLKTLVNHSEVNNSLLGQKVLMWPCSMILYNLRNRGEEGRFVLERQFAWRCCVRT